MIALVFILQLLGFLCLMLAMNKHAKQAGNSRVLTKVLRLLPSPPFTKLIGWMLLIVSLCLALTRIEIISIAIVWWGLHIMCSPPNYCRVLQFFT